MNDSALSDYFPRTFRFATGSAFNFGETKRVLLGLTRLVDRDAVNIDWSIKPELRIAYGELCEAAEQVECDLRAQLRLALAEADEITEDRVLNEKQRTAESGGLDAGIGYRITGLRLVLGDATVDREWRDTLIALRDGRINLRHALKAHPVIKYALRSGFLTLRDTPSKNVYIRNALERELRGSSAKSSGQLIRQALLSRSELRLLSNEGPHWLLLLENNARIRRLVIEIILGDPTFQDPGGRREEHEIDRFVQSFVDICERFSGSRPTVSLHETSTSGTHTGTVRASAAIELLKAGLDPLGYGVSLQRCKELLLEVQN